MVIMNALSGAETPRLEHQEDPIEQWVDIVVELRGQRVQRREVPRVWPEDLSKIEES